MGFGSKEDNSSDSGDAVDLSSTRKQVRIAYMKNPDPVFYNDLDDKIIDEIKDLGAEVVMISFEDIFFKFTDKIEIFQNSAPLDVDGFLLYGYMSPKQMGNLIQLIHVFDLMGVTCIYNSREVEILNSKLNQALTFAAHQVPIPKTFTSFSVKATKEFFYSDLKDKAIVKQCSDYGGDGITLSKHPDEGITFVAKLQWQNTQSIVQELVPDVWGRSIRVLLINGQPFSCAEYSDKSGDFRSNYSYHENFYVTSQMKNPKLSEYYQIAKKAVDSVSSDIIIAGVDLVDSESKGIFVLEVNMWPEMDDIEEATQLPVFKSFATAFYDKVSKRHQLHNSILSQSITHDNHFSSLNFGEESKLVPVDSE